MKRGAREGGSLSARTVRVGAVDRELRGAMWGLLADYYEGTDRAEFERDLADKSHVILLERPDDGSLQGFSTIVSRAERVGGRPVLTIFSGDTVVAAPYWGQTALQRAFLRHVMGRALARPLTPVYWYLITKGYKTYLLLARNFVEYWPRHDRPTPPWQQAIIDHVGSRRFGGAYDAARGVVRHRGSTQRLRDHVAPVDEALLAAADVRFFCERNPGHAEGDELCCIGRVDLRLWASYMAKLAGRRLGRRR